MGQKRTNTHFGGRLYQLVLKLAALVVFIASPSSAQEIRDFASGTYVSHVKLSPDGKYFSKVTYQHKGSELGIYDRRTLTRVSGMSLPGDMSFNWSEWASPTTLLASAETSLRIEGRQVYLPQTRTISFDITQKRDPVILFENEEKILRTNLSLNRVVDMLPRDPNHIVMGAWRNRDFDLFRVNVETGEALRIAKGGQLTLGWFTSIQGAPLLRIDCSSRYCRKIKFHRPEDGENPNDPNAKWTFFRSFDQSKADKETLLNLQPIGPTGKPDEFYVLDGRDEVERRSVRTFNIRTDEFTSTLYQDPEYDVGGVIIDPRTRKYAGAQIWRDRIAHELVDPEMQEHLESVNRYFKNSWNVTFKQISDDRSAGLIFASAPDERGAYYIYDFSTRETRQIGALNPNLHNYIDTETSVMSVEARDGTALTAYHTKPMSEAKGGLIVLVHGGPEARDVMDYDRDVQFLASRGYDVVRVNFRGSAGYGRDFAKAGYREWGGVMHTDVIDTVVDMQSRLGIDASRTCIMGHSYGGYAALLAGAMQPQLFNCIVAGAGPTDLVQVLKDERRAHGRDSRQLAYWEKSIGDLKKDRRLLKSISPVRLVERYDDPVLLIHGQRDSVVLAEHSKNMSKALNEAGKRVDYLEINGGHYHVFWSTRSRQTYLERLESFVNAHIGGTDDSSSQSALP